MYLGENVLIESSEENDIVRTQRVLYIDRPNNAVVLFDVEKAKALPTWHRLSDVHAGLEEGSKRTLRHDPWLVKMRANDRLTDAERVKRDHAWQVIEPIVASGPENVFDRRARGTLVTQILGCRLSSKSAIYRYLRRYWQGGQSINALVPRYNRCGARGNTRTSNAHGGAKRGRPSLVQELTGQRTGINVDENTRSKLVKIGKEFFENKGYTHRLAYRKGLAKYFHDGYEFLHDGAKVPMLPPPEQLPTFGQYKYWYLKDRDPDAAKRRREGEKVYLLKHRAIRGDSTSMAFGPGSLYQIDSTIGNVCLVSSRNPSLIVGRPIIYVIVDTFSRLVVGFTVGLEGPSWREAICAFENISTNKVEFCASIGIDISNDVWPVEHVPEAVIADRGELKGYKADQLADSLGIRVVNTPPYRPDWKPVVEKQFDLTDERVVRWLPGAVRRTERSERDYRLDAIMTLAQFRRILAYCFLDYNRTTLIEDYPLDADMRRDGVRPYPIRLWRWGIENRTGALRYFPPEVVRHRLLPRARGIVTERGLRYRKRHYMCEFIASQNWSAKSLFCKAQADLASRLKMSRIVATSIRACFVELKVRIALYAVEHEKKLCY